MGRHDPSRMIVALVCWLFAFCATAFLGFFKTSSHHGTSGVTISQTVPTDGSFPAHNPGNKLPGYDHSVPPGQTHLRPYVDAHARAAGPNAHQSPFSSAPPPSATGRATFWRNCPSFVPHSRNYGGQAGRALRRGNPGLKPWLCCITLRSTDLSPITFHLRAPQGRRVYSHAIAANVLEASTPARATTRNATPLRLGSATPIG
jgi:hypothetical protein